MFSGIVNGYGKVYSLNQEKNFMTYIVVLPTFLLYKLDIGASVANNGCCLTVTNIKNQHVTFNIIKETLNNTNLKYLKINDIINIERSLKIGDEIGGHLVTGHVSGIATVINIQISKHNTTVWFNVLDISLMKFIFNKGCICINGVSLTVGNILNNTFCVHLIPETLIRTNFKIIVIDQFVNIEIDFITQIVVHTTEQLNKY